MDGFFRNAGCDEHIIRETELILGRPFPASYIKFMRLSNGGEGFIGERYVSLWRCEDVPQYNRDYGIRKYLTEEFIAFGTDGGGEGYCFDHRRPGEPQVVRFALSSLDVDDIIREAETFEEFIRELPL